MDFSIIIPCYNLEGYIERCLNSILSQDYESKLYEIIVVLDSCKDNSEEIVRRMLRERVQDKVLSVKYNRAGLSRNSGLDFAQGKYVWFIDGDDFLVDLHAFSKLINVMVKSEATVSYLKIFLLKDL